MATTIVTISADEELVRRAERVAARQQTDLQSLIARYLSVLAATDEPIDESKLAPITRSALGLLKGLPDKPYKELLTEALVEKYGMNK